ncbi:MAG: TonB-dependent receptor, partial [Brevundimonas sp.]
MTFAYRSSLFLAASGAALLIAGAASAQEAPADTTAIDDIVVTGSRVPSRSRLDTLAPVDVVTAETLSTRGTTEFAAALAQTVPSLTFARPSVVDGTDSIRPATLRGLSP